MNKKYDLNDPSALAELNQMTNQYGIHFEQNLFDRPYVLIDCVVFQKIQKHGNGGRPEKITENIRLKAKKLKASGMSVRQIASILSISIGSVSAITRE